MGIGRPTEFPSAPTCVAPSAHCAPGLVRTDNVTAPPRYTVFDTDNNDMPDGSSVGVGTWVTRPRPPAPIAFGGVFVGPRVGGWANAVIVKITACDVARVSGVPSPKGANGVRTTVGASAGVVVDTGEMGVGEGVICGTVACAATVTLPGSWGTCGV